MNRAAESSPVIVIGMHRSGTAMITRALERLGVFMGENLSHDAESRLFIELNDWLLWQGGASWDNPRTGCLLLDSPEVRALSIDYLRSTLASPRVASFVGWSRYLKRRTPARLDTAWGFKDPRNTFTLPLWLELFPDARVIHVRRHGVDVAASLKTRHDKHIPAAQERYRRRKPMYVVMPKHGRFKTFVPSLRCATLEGGFGLWEEYLDEASRHVEELGPRALELSYEEFLEDPRRGAEALAGFCGVTASPEALEGVAGDADSSRSYAFREAPELVSYAQQVGDRLARRGYEPSAAVAAG